MSFKPVYYSQQDPQWKNDILGFGDPGDTIGYVGCALTSVAMFLSGFGLTETPKTLNEKLKAKDGFVSAGIKWGTVSQIYSNVSLKAFIPCANSDAPLAQIDASINAGQPAIVMVDSSPAAGLQTHWVLLYGRKGDDYLMLDPWPYQPGITKEDLLMPRYSRGNPLQRSIMHVILYEVYGAGGPIATPSTTTTPQTQTQPSSTPVSPSPRARVKADVTWGLNIRSSIDTSSMANVVASVPAGTELTLLEADGPAKVGGINQWVRVRDDQAHEGFAAAWYLEKVETTTPAPSTGSTSTSASDAPTPAAPAPSTPSTPTSTTSSTTTTTTPPEPAKLVVQVSSAVGSSGLRVRDAPSQGGSIISVAIAGSRLTVLEPADKAKAKVGVAGQWLMIKDLNGRRGYVQAQYVNLA